MTMEEKEKTLKKYHFKIVIVGLMFFFFFCVVVLRSYQLQILDNAKLIHLAQSQYKTNLVLTPKRGTIFDTHGDVLALDVLVSSVAIHPHLINDHQRVKDVLRKYLNVSQSELDRKLLSKRKFEWVKRRMPLEVGQNIEKEMIKGIGVLREYRRFYPNKDLAGQVLGAVGYDARALGGLELDYNDYLISKDKNTDVQRDARGKLFSPFEGEVTTHDLVLTLDKNIQHNVEEFLEAGAVKHRVKSGFAMVMDANSGDILAMANYPKFNPNSYWKFDQEYWHNHAVMDVYEPGSTFKTVSVAAALNSKKVLVGDRFFCENGSYAIGRNKIEDHEPYGWLTTSDILKVSSNIGATKIAQKIGRQTLYDFIMKMGFGHKISSQFSAETTGSLRNYKTWRDIELSNIAFGQGLAVNGLQMVAAYAAMINGGKLMEPRIVRKIVSNTNHEFLETNTSAVQNVMDALTSKQIREMLARVTEPGGTAVLAQIDGYLSGGKTGTAQKYDVAIKSYAKGNYISSFIGFSPLNDPKIVVYVVYDSPRKDGYYGGIVAAPVFRQISETTLQYFGITPEHSVKQKYTTNEQGQKNKKTSGMPSEISLQNESLELAKTKLKKNIVPDLGGMPLREVLKLVKEYHLQIKMEGNGVVVQQIPQPGANMKKDQSWKVKFASNT